MSKKYDYINYMERMCDDYCYFSKMSDMYSFDSETMCNECPLLELQKYIKRLRNKINEKERKSCSNTHM